MLQDQRLMNLTQDNFQRELETLLHAQAVEIDLILRIMDNLSALKLKEPHNQKISFGQISDLLTLKEFAEKS